LIAKPEILQMGRLRNAHVRFSFEAKELSVAEVKERRQTGNFTTFGEHGLPPLYFSGIKRHSMQLVRSVNRFQPGYSDLWETRLTSH
jgi:hypothetical protein